MEFRLAIGFCAGYTTIVIAIGLFVISFVSQQVFGTITDNNTVRFADTELNVTGNRTFKLTPSHYTGCGASDRSKVNSNSSYRSRSSSSSNNNNNNNNTCLKCSTSTGQCIKCPQLIIADEQRQCVATCPSGYFEEWATGELMGRVCRTATPRLSSALLATVAGIIFGALLCIVLVVAAAIYVKRKRRRKLVRAALLDDSAERQEFIRQLAEMRPNAEYFLAMLNDTRRQIRKLYLSGDTAGAQAYRPVVRDLAKILILLNRPIEVVASAGPPHDWSRLLTWAQRILDRYKPQIAQLIDFLQTPSLASGDPRLDGSCQHSTFKSNLTTSTTASETTNLNQLQLFGSLISLQDLEEPRGRSASAAAAAAKNFGPFNNLKYYQSDIHDSSLWLEDEFFKLGFRPQDEITTEL